MASWNRSPGRSTRVPAPISTARMAGMEASAAGEAAVEAAVGVHVAAEAGRQPRRVDLERAADGAAARLLPVDDGPPGRGELGVRGAEIGRLDGRALLGGGRPLRAAVPLADGGDPGGHLHPEVGEELARQRPERDGGRRGAGARALERVAGIVEAVLEDPGQVGVARPRAREARPPRAVGETRSFQFSWSLFQMTSAMGDPIVTPPRMPERNWASSFSMSWRPPRP